MNDSIVITGGSGFVGLRLASLLTQKYSVYIACKTYYDSLRHYGTFISLDVRNEKMVRQVIADIKPVAVIHAAAITNSDYCAKFSEKAFGVNVEGTKNLALAAEMIHARIIYLSTDLIFDGGRNFYIEEDVPMPICYYGMTKYEGELIVASISSNYCIARLGLIFGQSVGNSSCFTQKIIEKILYNQEIQLFNDEYRTPIYLDNLCALLDELIVRNELQGIYHLGGSERISRYDFGVRLAQVMGCDHSCIIPSSLFDYSFIDPRPSDCSMNNRKALTVLNTKLMTIDEGLDDMIKTQR